MQDLKHLSRKKRLSGFSFPRSSSANTRLTSTGGGVSRKLRLPTGKRLNRLKHLLLFIAMVLALAPICLATLNRVPDAARSVTAMLLPRRAATPKKAEVAKSHSASDFEIAGGLLDSASVAGEQLTARTGTGETLYYTIRGDLQRKVHDFMAANRVPYGVLVAIEPATGRVLAMTSYSSVDPGWERSASFDLYPMASLFKIVIASAALEARKITPQTVIEFRGGSYSENPRYWDASPRGKNNRQDVTHAMGKSINPVYGRIAADIAGKTSVMESVRNFGFNQKLLPDTPAKESLAAEPQGNHGLMLMGAGLDHEVKISPLHAAVMMAAIANGGRMMSPGLTDRLVDSKGKVRESHSPREIRRLVSPETAVSLTEMLSSTVTKGTSRKAFHDRAGRPLLDVEIAAKTGSINGTDPRGHYSWFAAYAPARNPRIALVALVINQDRWKIKSSQVGEQALEEFFRK